MRVQNKSLPEKFIHCPVQSVACTEPADIRTHGYKVFTKKKILNKQINPQTNEYCIHIINQFVIIIVYWVALGCSSRVTTDRIIGIVSARRVCLKY